MEVSERLQETFSEAHLVHDAPKLVRRHFLRWALQYYESTSALEEENSGSNGNGTYRQAQQAVAGLMATIRDEAATCSSRWQ